MLGRLRRTSRLDVGLALGFSGVACLIWFLVAGTSRDMVQEMIRCTQGSTAVGQLPPFTLGVKIFFIDAGPAIDMVGMAWLLASLVLVVYGSRQKLSISWAWASAISQSLVAALGGVLVGYAMNLPYRMLAAAGAKIPSPTALEQVSSISFPVVLTFSILIWVTFLVWLLVDLARYRRRGITLADGLRTNQYR